MDTKEPRSHILAKIFILVAVTVALYAPTIGFDFIAEYDDQEYLIDNPILEKPSFDGFVSIFTSFRETDYLPVLHTSFFLDALLWGKNPAGFHFMNLLLHLGNGILLFLLLSNLLDRKPVAFFTALVFLTHPVQVESVAWVTERKNVLSLFFLLIAFHYSLVRPCQWLGLLSYALSLLSKSIGTVFPVFLILTGPLLRKKVRASTLAGLLILAVTASTLTYITQSQHGAVKPYHGGSLGATLVLMGQTYWDYLFSLFTGRGLCPVHPAPPMNWPMGFGFYGITFAAALFLWIGKRWFLLWTMASFFLFLLPVSNLIPIAVLRADRYLYIPIIFFFLALLSLLDHGWREMLPRRPEIGIWLCGALLVFSYALATIQYLPVYRDAQSMWSCVAERPGQRATALYNLGVLEEKRGNLVKAAAHYELARSTGGHCGAVNNLGSLAFDRGSHEEAHDLYLEARAKCPNDPGILYNLGLSFLVKNEVDQARRCFEMVVEHGQYHPGLVGRAEEMLQQTRDQAEGPR
jgi:hypothetical protein